MNENIDLTKILKDCPKGTKLYSTIFGEVEFKYIHNSSRTIGYETNTGRNFDVSHEGKFFRDYDGECTLFPSKDQKDWSKFTAPWYKNEKFDPKTLKPFDKVLVRDYDSDFWRCSFYSHKRKEEEITTYRYETPDNSYAFCIPYNEETKHLVGTNDEAPEYYRYWEE